MIERILDLLEERGITAYKLTTDLGLGNGVVTQWKQGKQKPGTDAIIKIAKYFGVSTDYLLTGEDTETPNNNELSDMLSDDVKEILRIAKALDLKRRHKLLSLAFELEENSNPNPVQDEL